MTSFNATLTSCRRITFSIVKVVVHYICFIKPGHRATEVAFVALSTAALTNTEKNKLIRDLCIFYLAAFGVDVQIHLCFCFKCQFRIIDCSRFLF